MPGKMVPMVAPNGAIGDIPEESVQDAVHKGFRLGAELMSPDGKRGVVPMDKVHDAIKSGFMLAPAGMPSAPVPKNLQGAPTAADASVPDEDRGSWEGVKRGMKNLVHMPVDLAKAAFQEPQTPEEDALAAGGGVVPGGSQVALGLKRLVVDPAVNEWQTANAYEQKAQNEDDYSANNWLTGDQYMANVHRIGAAVPIVGPMAAQLVDRAMGGDPSGAVAEMGTYMVAPKVAENAIGKAMPVASKAIDKVANSAPPEAVVKSGAVDLTAGQRGGRAAAWLEEKLRDTNVGGKIFEKTNDLQRAQVLKEAQSVSADMAGEAPVPRETSALETGKKVSNSYDTALDNAGKSYDVASRKLEESGVGNVRIDPRGLKVEAQRLIDELTPPEGYEQGFSGHMSPRQKAIDILGNFAKDDASLTVNDALKLQKQLAAETRNADMVPHAGALKTLNKTLHEEAFKAVDNAGFGDNLANEFKASAENYRKIRTAWDESNLRNTIQNNPEAVVDVVLKKGARGNIDNLRMVTDKGTFRQLQRASFDRLVEKAADEVTGEFNLRKFIKLYNGLGEDTPKALWGDNASYGKMTDFVNTAQKVAESIEKTRSPKRVTAADIGGEAVRAAAGAGLYLLSHNPWVAGLVYGGRIGTWVMSQVIAHPQVLDSVTRVMKSGLKVANATNKTAYNAAMKVHISDTAKAMALYQSLSVQHMRHQMAKDGE